MQFFDAYTSLFSPLLSSVSFRVLSRGVVIYRIVSPSPPPRLARLIRKRRRGGGNVLWRSGEVLAAVCYFFSRGCLYRTERPGNESFRSSPFILQHLHDVSICIWSIVYTVYIYMVTVYCTGRFTSSSSSPVTPFSSLIIFNFIFRIFKYYIIIFLRTSHG